MRTMSKKTTQIEIVVQITNNVDIMNLCFISAFLLFHVL